MNVLSVFNRLSRLFFYFVDPIINIINRIYNSQLGIKTIVGPKANDSFVNKSGYFIFDIETTGLPICRGWNSYYSPNNLEYYDCARIVEIAWMKIINGKIITEQTFLVKPDNFLIPPSATSIHGISQDMVEEQGIVWTELVKRLLKDIKDIDIMVGHNILFDYNILLSELFRLNTAESVNKRNIK